jgi:hypothetical protein
MTGTEDDERRPLLRTTSQLDAGEGGDSRELIQFGEEDVENPKQWKWSEKLMNMGVIACMAIMSPLASSMFTPGINQIAEGLNTNPQTVIGCTTGYVVCGHFRSASILSRDADLIQIMLGTM